MCRPSRGGRRVRRVRVPAGDVVLAVALGSEAALEQAQDVPPPGSVASIRRPSCSRLERGLGLPGPAPPSAPGYHSIAIGVDRPAWLSHTSQPCDPSRGARTRSGSSPGRRGRQAPPTHGRARRPARSSGSIASAWRWIAGHGTWGSGCAARYMKHPTSAPLTVVTHDEYRPRRVKTRDKNDGTASVGRMPQPRDSAVPRGGGVRKRRRTRFGRRARTTRPHGSLRCLPGHSVARRRSSRLRRLRRGQEIADGLRRGDRGRPRGDKDAGGTDAGDLVARRFARRLPRPPVRSSRSLDPGPDHRAGVAHRGSRGRAHRLSAIAARRDRDRASIRGRRYRVGRVCAGSRARDVGRRRPCRRLGRARAITRRALRCLPSRRGPTRGPRRDGDRDRRDAHARRRPPGRMGPPRGVVLHGRSALSRGRGGQRLALCRLARAGGRRPGRTAGAGRP